MSPRAALAIAFIILTFGLACVAATAGTHVLVVSVEQGGAHDQAIAAFSDTLSRRHPQAHIARADDYPPALHNDAPRPQIIVTVGAQAAQRIGGGPDGITVINMLLPSHGFAELHAGRSETELARISAVFIDQPLSRQVALVREALPHWTTLALISGPHTQELATRAESIAHVAGLAVRRHHVDNSRELYSALRSTLQSPAVLLALPERELFTSTTIQNILLTTYRLGSPLVGFSAAYVRAGALVAVYSRPDQLGSETAELVAAVLAGGGLPAPRHPQTFEVGVNSTVARSLGIRIDPAEEIAARLRQRESATHD